MKPKELDELLDRIDAEIKDNFNQIQSDKRKSRRLRGLCRDCKTPAEPNRRLIKKNQRDRKTASR
jgi:hypothetical protein